MFCSQCGKEVSDEWNVCPNCGAPINKQGIGNEYYYDGSNVVNQSKMPPMKWYKFIIYFQIFLNIAICLYYAYEIYSGQNYGFSTEKAYAMYGGLKGVDYIMGAIYILYVASLIFVRHQLWKYKKNAWKYYIAFYCAFNVVQIAYRAMQCVIVNTNLIDFQAITDIIYSAIYIVLNYIYFKKRDNLFTN